MTKYLLSAFTGLTFLLSGAAIADEEKAAEEKIKTEKSERAQLKELKAKYE